MIDQIPDLLEQISKAVFVKGMSGGARLILILWQYFTWSLKWFSWIRGEFVWKSAFGILIQTLFIPPKNASHFRGMKNDISCVQIKISESTFIYEKLPLEKSPWECILATQVFCLCGYFDILTLFLECKTRSYRQNLFLSGQILHYKRKELLSELINTIRWFKIHAFSTKFEFYRYR